MDEGFGDTRSRATRPRRGRFLVVLAALWCCVFGVSPVRADFVDTKDNPASDYDYAQRQLCYTIEGDMAKSELWQSWVDNAAANWNKVSSQTGWSFRQCGPGETANVRILFGKGDRGDSAGTTFVEENPTRQCRVAIVQNVAGQTIDGTVVSGGWKGDGWRLEDDANSGKTLDPINVVMHEFTHCMRLSHLGPAWDTGSFEEPISPGHHGPRTPSAKDITQLATSAADGKPAASVASTLPPCVKDEADRAAIKAKIEAELAQEQAKLQAADAALHTHGADVAKEYAEAKQATSNIETLNTLLAALAVLPTCGAGTTKQPIGQTTPQPGSAASTSAPCSYGGAGSSSTAALESGVLNELNAARADPPAYATRLQRYEAYYRGNLVSEPGHPVAMTIEGVAAVTDAVGFLDHRTPAPALQWSDALSCAARRLVVDLGPKGGLGHTGSDGSTMPQRIRDVGVWASATEETISLVPRTADGVVRQLVIDDGVPTRGHRTALFDPGLSIAGVACGPHAAYGWMCVIDFAGSLLPPPGSESGGFTVPPTPLPPPPPPPPPP